MSIKKENLFYIAVLIPIVMIVIAAFCLLNNAKNASPTQNFLYIYSSEMLPAYCSNEIKATITSSGPAIAPIAAPVTPAAYKKAPCPSFKLYIYHFKTASSSEITVEQAKHLSLSWKPYSNEGFQIDGYCPRRTFGPSNYNTYYRSFCLTKGRYRKSVNPNLPAAPSAYNFVTFAAWLQGDNK